MNDALEFPKMFSAYVEVVPSTGEIRVVLVVERFSDVTEAQEFAECISEDMSNTDETIH